MTVGMIGLGALGRAMAERLVATGEEVRAFDIDPQAMDRLETNLIAFEPDPRSLADRCDVLLSVVWDDAALRQVVFGPDGVLASDSFAGCLIDLSTTSVAAAIAVGEAFDGREGAFLDGAVIGGGVPAAVAGQSPIVVAGDKAWFDRVAPVLSRLGGCEHVGPLGAAKTVKIVNNHLVGVLSAANAEAMSLGKSSGIEPDVLFEVLRKTRASSFPLEAYFGRYLQEGRYGDGLIGHDLMHKDVSLAVDLAETLDCPAPIAGIAQQFYLACSQGMGGRAPFPSSFDYLRRLAGDARPTPEHASASPGG